MSALQDRLDASPLGKFLCLRRDLPQPPPFVPIFETMDRAVAQGVLGGPDMKNAIAAYQQNNEKVRDMIPADRFLVFLPSDDREPLCRFLRVVVPDVPIPRTHARDEFWARFAVSRRCPETLPCGAGRIRFRRCSALTVHVGMIPDFRYAMLGGPLWGLSDANVLLQWAELRRHG